MTSPGPKPVEPEFVVDSRVFSCAGATLSEKNAVAEYKLKKEDLDGLPFVRRSVFGNSYRLFVRSHVEKRARDVQGNAYEINQARNELKVVTAKISELQAQLSKQDDRKVQLEKKIHDLGGSVTEPPKAKKAKTKAK